MPKQRVWAKVKAPRTLDMLVVGFTGDTEAPNALVLAFPGDVNEEGRPDTAGSTTALSKAVGKSLSRLLEPTGEAFERTLAWRAGAPTRVAVVTPFVVEVEAVGPAGRIEVYTRSMARGGPRASSKGHGRVSGGGPAVAFRPGAGRLDVRVLEQGRVWMDTDGPARRVRDLSYDEACALRDDLRAHGDLLYAVVLRREVAARLLALTLGVPEPTGSAPGEGPGEGPVEGPGAGPGAAAAGRSVRPALDSPGAAEVGTGNLGGEWPELSTRARVRVWAALGRGPRVWLESTPLMRSLQRQLDRGASQGREWL